MSRTYWRVAPAFWGDEKVSSWDDDTKMLALYLLTCEHRAAEGLFRLPLGYILTDIGWVSERLRNPFETLLRDGFMEYDNRCSVVFITNALAYQAPENPNQVKGAIARVEELPETPLLQRLYERSLDLCPTLAESLSKRFGKRFETLRQTPSKPPALPPALPPSLSETPPVAREAVPVENGGGGGEDVAEDGETEPDLDNPTLWELWALPEWKKQPKADAELIVQIRREYPGVSLDAVFADYRLAAGDTEIGQPRRFMMARAKHLHERAGPEAPPDLVRADMVASLAAMVADGCRVEDLRAMCVSDAEYEAVISHCDQAKKPVAS